MVNIEKDAAVIARGRRTAAKAQPEYFTLDEALAVLEVRPQTLYAYVSRGLIRRVPAASGRSSLYLRADVEQAKARSAARVRGPRAQQKALNLGESALLTGITEITSRGPRYRNRHALSFAREGCGFEAVAEYLWGGDWDGAAHGWYEVPHHEQALDVVRVAAAMRPQVHILELFKVAATALGISEGSRKERLMRGEAAVSAGRRLIRVMAGMFGFLAPQRRYEPLSPGEPVAAALARIFGHEQDAGMVAALDRALVLVADHEINPATFAARIAASTHADLNSCLAAALSVHYGRRTCDAVGALLSPSASRESLVARLRGHIDTDRSPPGFNHLLYPNGDPRAAYLIELAAERAGTGSEVRATLDLVAELERVYGLRPKVDLGLVLLVRALGLPDQAASGLFAFGRSAGWVAHVLEQRLAGFMFQPRTLYYPSTPAQPKN